MEAGNDQNAIVFPVPPPEADSPNETTNILSKRPTAELPLPVLPNPKRPSYPKPHSLLSGYAIEQINPIAIVDRTHFYDRFIFHKQANIRESDPARVELRPGMVIGLWQFGGTPMVIKALTNNRGTSVMWKLILKKIPESRLVNEEIPECSNSNISDPPDGELIVQVSEIWHLYTTIIPELQDPQICVQEKQDEITARKKRNQERIKSAKETNGDSTKIVKETITRDPNRFTNIPRPIAPKPMGNAQLANCSPLSMPPSGTITLSTDTWNLLLKNNAETLQQLADSVTESRNIMKNSIIAHQKATEKILTEITTSFDQSAKKMQELVALSQQNMLQAMLQANNHNQTEYK